MERKGVGGGGVVESMLLLPGVAIRPVTGDHRGAELSFRWCLVRAEPAAVMTVGWL